MPSQAAELGGRLRSRVAAGLEKHVPRLAAGLERQAPRIAAELERRVPAIGRRMSPVLHSLPHAGELPAAEVSGQRMTTAPRYRGVCNSRYTLRRYKGQRYV